LTKLTKTLIQCDFDGTVTEEDVSFALLDAYTNGGWRKQLRQYEEKKITVGRFNAEAFAMVKASRQSLVKTAKNMAKLRPGFPELVACCRRKNFRLVIVSNGLDFYIEEILKDAGLGDIEFHAAQTQFYPDGLKVQYIAPDGTCLDDDFKKAYVDSFLSGGYRIIYIGNGSSDLAPARNCHRIFATSSLLSHCRQENLNCIAFNDFHQVVKVLELL